MRRALLGLVPVAVVVLAALVPAPDPGPEPLAGVIIERPGIESPLDEAIWYCPWAQATGSRDSTLAVASMDAATALLTFPVAIPGEDADVASLEVAGPGGATLALSNVAQRGDSPVFIEFDDGPSSASVTVTGDMLAADACVAQGPDEWFFVGGSTRTGERLRLRLFNPFPEIAKVTVAGFSEIGTEALGELRSVTVNARSWRDIDFEELLRERETLAISVRADDGLIVPAMAFTPEGDDAAWWGGTGLSTEWEFPIVRQAGVVGASVVVANPGLADADLSVDVYTRSGAQRAAYTLTVGSEGVARITFDDVEETVLGARVASTSPIAAAVVAGGDAGIAVTQGSPTLGTSWLLPGLGPLPGHQAFLWLLNSGDEAVTVTVGTLTADATLNTKEVLEPGTILRIPIEEPGAVGYIVFAADPFTAAWSISGPEGVAYVSGLAVPGD